MVLQQLTAAAVVAAGTTAARQRHEPAHDKPQQTAAAAAEVLLSVLAAAAAAAVLVSAASHTGLDSWHSAAIAPAATAAFAADGSAVPAKSMLAGCRAAHQLQRADCRLHCQRYPLLLLLLHVQCQAHSSCMRLPHGSHLCQRMRHQQLLVRGCALPGTQLLCSKSCLQTPPLLPLL
jgi:hypothetical protein